MKKQVKGPLISAFAAAALGMALSAPTYADDMSVPEAYKFDDKGELMLLDPSVYRKWVFVGTPLTPNELNNGKAPFPEFHSVYIEPKAFDVYEKTGKFPDNTIMVKELISVGSKAAVSGQGYFMGEFIGLEATIKDKDRFAKEPGNWAYFSFSSPDHDFKKLTKTAKAFEAASCNACHAAAAQDDFVFTQYYPVLRAAKGGQ